jgi:hypothetical protein
MRRIERSDQICKRMPIRGLLEASKRCLSFDVQLIRKLRGRLLREVFDGGEQFAMAILEGALDALVEFLIAARRLDRPYVATANYGGIGRIEVESEVDLVKGAKIEVLRIVSYMITSAATLRKLTFILRYSLRARDSE